MIDSDGKVVNPFRCERCRELQDIFDTPCTACGKSKSFAKQQCKQSCGFTLVDLGNEPIFNGNLFCTDSKGHEGIHSYMTGVPDD